MKVSIILPTYKPSSYINECLASIDNQTLNKEMFELIVILNGCDEPFRTNLNSYISCNISDDLDITLIQTDQSGVSNARNIGIEHARGEFITFIDDDDYVSPSYLEELLNNTTPNIVSLSNTIAFEDLTGKQDSNYRISKAFKENELTTLNGARRFFSGPVMKLIHRDVIGDRRFDASFSIGEDSQFMFLISDRIKKCKFTSKNAVYYRRNREGSAVRTSRSKKEVARHQWKMIKNYVGVYIKNPLKYNVFFFITRIIAALKVYMISILK